MYNNNLLYSSSLNTIFSSLQLQIARKNALITHAHINGINGAIMQAMAVFTALCIEPPNLEPSSFIDQLTEVAEKLEQSTTEER